MLSRKIFNSQIWMNRRTTTTIGIRSFNKSVSILQQQQQAAASQASAASAQQHMHRADELPNHRQMTVNHELPDPLKEQRRQRLMFWSFAAVMGVSLFCIFNYEKTSSPIMNATLYFLRRSEVARAKLGKEITFAGLFPWIHGELNTMIGNVDVNFRVQGDKNSGLMVLKAHRDSRQQEFKIETWELIVDGEIIDLLADTSIEFNL